MKWIGVVIVLYGVFKSSLPAQSPDTLALLQILPVAASFATADNLGNIYLLTAANSLEKYDAEGQRLSRYSNNRLGQATAIDVSNPLKILLWYADFRTVVFLDRSLTELGSLNLGDLGFSLVRNVAASFDGNIWVYEEAEFKLKKISPEGETLFETPALTQLFSVPPTADDLKEIGNQVYLADRRQGIFIFNQYALWEETWTDGTGQDFYVAGDRRYALSDSTLYITIRQPVAEKNFLLTGNRGEKSRFRLTERQLLIWDDTQVQVYRLP